MNADRTHRRSRRTPGERAFDRCFVPLAAFAAFTVIANLVAMASRPSFQLLNKATLKAGGPAPEWQGWLFFAAGLLFAVLWVRALVSVVAAWSDPSSRVLRFSSLALLVPFAFLTRALLLVSFQH